MNNLDMKLKEFFIGFLTENTEGLQVEEKDGTIKHFEKVNGKWNLYAIEDGNEVFVLNNIPGFSNYKACLEHGKIYSLVSDRWLNPKTKNYYGYIFTTIKDDNGQAVPMSVHSIIMSAFRSETQQSWIERGYEIDHKNGVKHQNNISNLRLVTRKEQYTDEVRQRMSRNAGTPLTKEQVQYIRYFTAIVKAKGKMVDSKLIHMLANKYDKKYETIRKVVLGVTHSEINISEVMKREVRKIELQYDLEQLELIA